MLKQRREKTEWRGDYLYIASKVTVPTDILNACSAQMNPPVSEREFSGRGISFYNPGGEHGQINTLCLVWSPKLGKEGHCSTGNAAMSKESQSVLRRGLISSFQRLNVLRSLLNLYPFFSTLNGFGQLGDHLRQFMKLDNEKHRVYSSDKYEKIGTLCPIESEDSTFQVLLKMCPEHMSSLFELRFIIRKRCLECKKTEPDKNIAITSLSIDSLDNTALSTDDRIASVFRRMLEVCCFSTEHDFEIQNAPPILAVLSNPGSGKSDVCYPRLDISLTKVFRSGNRDDLTYQLVSVCSRKKNEHLWIAHCKSYQTGRWKIIQDEDHIQNQNWADTCRMWNHTHTLLLFYVKTSAIPHISDDPNCLSEGMWVQAKYKSGRGVRPAQIARIYRSAKQEIKFKLNWDDGNDNDTFKGASDVYPLMDVVDGNPKFQICEKVMVQTGEYYDNKIFPAVISRCFSNKQYLITWEDGDTTYRVHNESVIQRRNANSDQVPFQGQGCNEAVKGDLNTRTTLAMDINQSTGGVSKTTTEGGSKAIGISGANDEAIEKADSDSIKKRESSKQGRSQETLKSSDEDVHPNSPVLPGLLHDKPVRKKKNRIDETMKIVGSNCQDLEMAQSSESMKRSGRQRRKMVESSDEDVDPKSAVTEQITTKPNDPALHGVRGLRTQYQEEHQTEGPVHVSVKLDFP